MSGHGLWSRIRKGRLVQVLGVYLAVSWVVLQVIGELRESLGLPEWIGPAALIFLLLGLVIVLATAWVQSHPLIDQREATDEVPRSWELDVAAIKSSLKRGEVPHLTWARALLGGVFVFSLLFGVAGLYIVIRDRGESLSPPVALAEDAAPAIAILPFTVRGEGLELWREGLPQSLYHNLDGAAELRVIDPHTTLARWDRTIGESRNPEFATVLEVARATGARWALTGSVIQSGAGVRLSADIHDVGSGQPIGRGRVEGSPDSVFVLVDELSIEILRSLFSDRETDFAFDLARVTSHSVPALRAYLEGDALFRRGDFESAVPLYRRAIEQDSAFGLAHHRLAQAYGWLRTVAGNQPRDEALEHAMRHVDRLPPREALIVRAHNAFAHGDYSMVDSLEVAARRYPDDAEVWYLLGDFQLHGGPRLPSNLEQIEEIFVRAVELDPDFAQYLIHWVDLAMWWRPDSAKAAVRLRRLEESAPASDYASRARIAFELAFGDSATRAARLQELPSLDWDTRRSLAANQLFHGRFAPQRETLIRSLLEGATGADRRAWTVRLARTLALGRGQTARARALLEGPGLPPGFPACELWELSQWGALPDEAALDAAIAAARERLPAAPPPQVRWCLANARATIAADRGRWDDHAAAMDTLEALAAGLPEEIPDPRELAAVQRIVNARLAALDGYARWRRGDLEGAVEALREASLDGLARWWLAQTLIEAGRWVETERWLRSFWWAEHSLAHYHLGRVYEELGNPERAIEAYRYFVEAWYEADPEFQPLVEEARQSIARLTDAPRGG